MIWSNVYDAGTQSGNVCVYKKALAANTVYALVLNNTGEAVGTVGPLTATTYAGADTNGVQIDTNTVLDTVTTLAKPAEGMTLTVTKNAKVNGAKFVYGPGVTA